MRSYAIFFALLAAMVTQSMAQVAGDPVTYTRGQIVYTAVLDPDLDTVSPVPASTIAAGAALTTAITTTRAPVTTTAAAAQAPVSQLTFAAPMTASPTSQYGSSHFAEDDNESGGYLVFQRRSPIPTPPSLLKRQGGAALGGGAGVVTTQTGLQSIAGYQPPAQTVAPSPTNYASGSIMSASQIPGYGQTQNTGTTGGTTSGSIRLEVTKIVMGSVVGAVIFALC